MEPIKKFSPALFGIIILCFFLPFANLSCSGQTVMTLTGFQLITGTEYSDQNMMGQNMFDQNNENNANNKSREVQSQPMALFALIAAVAGLAVGFIRKKTTALISLVIAVLGVVFLFLLKINMDGDAALSGQGIIKLEYQSGYWLTIILFIAAAVVQWLIYNEKKKPESVIAETPIAPQ